LIIYDLYIIYRNMTVERLAMERNIAFIMKDEYKLKIIDEVIKEKEDAGI
jgi:hypothetical protein